MPGEETQLLLTIRGDLGAIGLEEHCPSARLALVELSSNEPDLSGLTQPDMGQVPYLGVKD